MARKIVIVGGVAAGAGAAVKARRTDEEAEIVLLERGPYVSFANCGLPYYVGGAIEELKQLLVVAPARLRDRYRLDVRTGHEAVGIDRAARRVRVRGTGGAEYEEDYDYLVLATGAGPMKPDIPGLELPGVFTLTTVDDAVAIREYIREREAHFGAVLGGGYIGLESAEALAAQDLKVSLVERLDRIMPLIGPEMTAPVLAHLRANEVSVHLKSEAVEALGSDRLTGLRLKGGEEIPADVLIVAAGVDPRIELASQAGLEVAGGGIVVDERMRTSDPRIFAAGDIVLSKSLINGTRIRLPLAGPANKQGRVAGANAAGGEMRFAGVVGASVVKVFDLTLGQVGMGEEEARRAGFKPLISYTHSSHHSTYYPGAEVMALKLVADRESGKILGAEIVGGQGVDKRLDILATAIYAGLKVTDLEQLDLAYAPPFSSAKDPIVVAGMVAANLFRGEFTAVTSRELARRLEEGEGVQIVDVRTTREYQSGHIKGALNIPLDDLRGRLTELDSSRPVVVYCGIGYRSYHAARILQARGFKDVRNLSGGMSSWQWVGEVEK